MVNMKNENADWKSELPDGWKIFPLKHFFRFGKGLSIGKKDLIEAGAPVISYGQVHSKTNSGVHSSDDLIRYVDESYYESNMNSFAKPGDFIFADTSEDLEGCGNEAYVDYNKGLFAGYHTILLKANNGEDNRYFGYLFQTDDFRYQIRSEVTRVKVYSISQAILKRAFIIVPPYPERIEIADFLDKKCTEIDSAISLARSQIDALKRYKTSVITQAVTKGLDPNAEMKDSGVEWIGKIPKDWKSELPDGWNIYPLKYFFSFGKGLSIGKKDLIETGAPVISYGQVHSKTNSGVHSSEDLIRYVDESYYECGMNSFATSGDFIFADTSEDLEGCGNEAYVDYDKGLFAGYHTILLKAKNNEDNRYFGYLFQTDDFRYQIRSYVTRVKVYSISQVLLKRAAVIVPPYAKRIEIADYLDEKCAKINASIATQEAIIDKLNEYKKSLIYNAVTGKIDCREVKA